MRNTPLNLVFRHGPLCDRGSFLGYCFNVSVTLSEAVFCFGRLFDAAHCRGSFSLSMFRVKDAVECSESVP